MGDLGDLLPWMGDLGRAGVIASALLISYRLIRSAYADAITRYKETNTELTTEAKDLRVKVAELEARLDKATEALAQCRAESLLHKAREEALEERVELMEAKISLLTNGGPHPT